MPTAAEKILSRAVGRPVRIGEIVHPVPDLVTLHDWYVTHAADALDRFGVTEVVRPERVMVSTDHEPVAASPAAAARQGRARAAAARFRFGHFHDVGRGGLGHVFPVETGLVRPGMLVMGYDPHLTNFGAVGALGLCVLNEVTELLACGTVWTEVPETVRVAVVGTLGPGVTVRDAAQRFIAANDPEVLDDAVVEFAGPGLQDMSVARRMTLVNTTVELGARSALVEPDEAILAGYVALTDEDRHVVRSDADATFRAVLELDLGTVVPQVALPPRPECSVPVTEAVGRPITHAYIGSCASGFLEDLRLAAGVLRGRRVASGVRLFVTPVTNTVLAQAAREGLLEVFTEAGAVLTAPGCGVCAGGRIGGVAAGDVSIGTGTRNDAGRLGSTEAELMLAGPLTVAASAVTGVVTDPRDFAGDGPVTGFSWIMRGRAWVFGHDIGVDGDLMPLEFALRRETDPEVLRAHVFAGVDPSLAARMRPRDIVVAGRRFAQGNPHIQGLLGLRGAGVGLVAESVPSGSRRNAVNAGLPMLPRCPGATGEVGDGDLLEVNFATGRFCNLTRGTERRWPPLPEVLRNIVEMGGWEAAFRARLAGEPHAASP